jgi:pheromone shutdown protein TraB
LITSGLKLGDRSQLGALVLAASLVANLLLMIAVSMWAISEGGMEQTASPAIIAAVISLAYGALAANIVSVTVLVSDTLM